MAEIIQKVEKLRYKTVEIAKLTRGIAKDTTELIGNTPLVRFEPGHRRSQSRSCRQARILQPTVQR